MDAIPDDEKIPDKSFGYGTERVRKAVTPRLRKPTPLQTARWRAVRKAQREGLSMKPSWDRPGLGIHRDNVKKYMNAESPPIARGRAKSTVS